MKNTIYLMLIFLLFPTLLFSQEVNVEVFGDGQVGEIYYKNISKNYRVHILAQLVADDVIKHAKSLADTDNYNDAHLLLSSITYLDYNNTNALGLAASYLKKQISNDMDKAKLHKELMSEINAVQRQKKSSHNIEIERGIVIAEEAKALYSEGTNEYKESNDKIEELKKNINIEKPSQEILNKLLKDANIEKENGKYIAAINKYSILFYAENSTLPLVEIINLLKSHK